MTNRTMTLPAYFVIQMGYLTTSESVHLWNDYTEQLFQNIPLISIHPFEFNVSPLYAIHKKDASRLDNLYRQQHCCIRQCIRHRIQYVCDEDELRTAGMEYMMRTQAYKEIENLAQRNVRGIVCHFLNTITTEIKLLLDKLYEQQEMTPFQYEQMRIKRYLARMDYLLFLPDTADHHEKLRFRPFTVSTLNPLMSICRYLYRLLAPIYYNHVAHHLTIHESTDLMPHLEHYEAHGYLTSSTRLITIHIDDPSTSVTHEQLLSRLKAFLHDYATEDNIQGMKHTAILQLAACFLHNQYFLYENRIYQQVKGSTNELYFTELLIDIYLFYWQKLLRSHQKPYDIFVRQSNDLFLTWNESDDELDQLVNTMQQIQPSLSFEVNTDKTNKELRYRDLQIGHLSDHRFRVSIYHDWRFEPFMLPTVPKVAMMPPPAIFRLALLRAVLCCSQLADFENEQQYIEYSFLFHRFSFESIRHWFDRFLLEFGSSNCREFRDQTVYDEFRRRVALYAQQCREERRRHFDEEQGKCIWYIYTRLKGPGLVKAREEPWRLLPEEFRDDYFNANDIKLEVIHIPYYSLKNYG